MTSEQIKEIKSEMVDANHTVYWNFTRETAKKVAAWTESRVEFSE